MFLEDGTFVCVRSIKLAGSFCFRAFFLSSSCFFVFLARSSLVIPVRDGNVIWDTFLPTPKLYQPLPSSSARSTALNVEHFEMRETHTANPYARVCVTKLFAGDRSLPVNKAIFRCSSVHLV